MHESECMKVNKRRRMNEELMLHTIFFIYSSVFQAAIIFILNAGSEDKNVRRSGTKNLARCAAFYSSGGMQFRIARILAQLSKRYSAEDESNEINGCDMGISTNLDTVSNYRNDTGTSGNNNGRSNKNQSNTITIPMLSSTSAEALFVSSLPREIALFNKLPNNRALRPCFQDLKINVQAPGALLPIPDNGSDSRRANSFLMKDIRTINTTVQQHQSHHGQVQPILRATSTITTNPNAHNNHIDRHLIDNDITMSDQLHVMPIDIIDNQAIVDPSSTPMGMSLDDIFRQQQTAINSAMDLLPVHNLPQGIYWTQEEWDVFLQELGYERPL